MPDHESIIEWYKSTGMRPYLEKLDEQEEASSPQGFWPASETSIRCKEDGRVLFPFRRLFFIATGDRPQVVDRGVHCCRD